MRAIWAGLAGSIIWTHTSWTKWWFNFSVATWTSLTFWAITKFIGVLSFEYRIFNHYSNSSTFAQFTAVLILMLRIISGLFCLRHLVYEILHSGLTEFGFLLFGQIPLQVKRYGLLLLQRGLTSAVHITLVGKTGLAIETLFIFVRHIVNVIQL